MDIFFGLVIVANGVMMGLTTQGVVDESSEEAQIFELVPWKIAWDITDIHLQNLSCSTNATGMWVLWMVLRLQHLDLKGES